MRLPRVRFTVRRLMGVVLVVSPIFAWLPWPVCAGAAGVIVPLILVEEWMSIGLIAYCSIAGLLLGLLLPTVKAVSKRPTTPPPAAGPAAGPSLADPPPLEEMDNGPSGL